MRTKITKEQVISVYNKNGYDVLKYNGLGTRTKHIVKHRFCGYKYPSDYDHFKNGCRRCPNCAGQAKITKEQVISIYNKNGYDVLKYNGLGARTKHIVKHRFCGYKYPSCYDNFKNKGRRCPNCAGQAKITKEQVISIYNKNGYDVLKYNGLGARTKHIVKHRFCGYKYPSCYDNFKNKGRRCPNCAGQAKITKEQVISIYNKNGYDVLKYNGSGNKTKHIVKHRFCGYKFPSDYNKFKNMGRRCPNCKSLRSEKLCRKIFCEIFSGYEFLKCRPSFLKGLELDGYCEVLRIAFEYNGKQHYKLCCVIPYDTQELLEERQERDKRKLDICIQEGIKLCVIPYAYNCSDPKKLETFIRDWVGKNREKVIDEQQESKDDNVIEEEDVDEQQECEDDVIDEQQECKEDVIEEDVDEQQECKEDVIEEDVDEQQECEDDVIEEEDVDEQQECKEDVDEQQECEDDVIEEEDVDEQQECKEDVIEEEDIVKECIDDSKTEDKNGIEENVGDKKCEGVRKTKNETYQARMKTNGKEKSRTFETKAEAVKQRKEWATSSYSIIDINQLFTQNNKNI